MGRNRSASSSGEKWRPALRAIGCAESLRPLFKRWAAGGTHELYCAVMQDLWAGRGLAVKNGSKHLRAIKRLPESSFDDSHFRDYFVMLGLGVLNFAIQVVQSRSDADVQDNMTEVETVMESLSGTLRVPLELHAAVLEFPPDMDLEAAADETRRRAEGHAERVNAALEPVARIYGWPADRPAGTSGGQKFSIVAVPDDSEPIDLGNLLDEDDPVRSRE